MVKSLIYLYDHRINTKTPTTYKKLSELTGLSITTLPAYKSRGRRLERIDVYIIDDNTSLKQKRKWHSELEFKGERWKTIKDHPNFKVSNYGRVRNRDRFLLPTNDKNEGLSVTLYDRGRLHKYRVARLVYSHFVRKLKDNELVIHKNGISTDDYVFNLKPISRKQTGQLNAWKSNAKTVVKIDKKTMRIVDEYKSATIAAEDNYMSSGSMARRCRLELDYEDEKFIFRYLEDGEQYG